VHYTPLLERERGSSIEEKNRNWRDSARGKRSLEKMKQRREERERGKETTRGLDGEVDETATVSLERSTSDEVGAAVGRIA
jgi:flagellar biosynthesis chaperone FliJ